MNTPDHSEDVGGVEGVPSESQFHRLVDIARDEANRLGPVSVHPLPPAPAPRIHWKARAEHFLAQSEDFERRFLFWRVVSLYLAITLALCVAALAVAVLK
jgi:hypothetical protein